MVFNGVKEHGIVPYRENSRAFAFVFPHHDGYKDLLISCDRMAYMIRNLSVYSMTSGALGHPGGTFSEAEILSVLYNYILRYDASDPNWEMRDVFYLSKCHACPGLYATLALFGYFPESWLATYGTWGSNLESHPDRLKTPGIEVSGGSLGQVPSVAVGRALAMKQKGPDHYGRMVYALVGDGECNEGSVWEAFMAAGHFGLDNLVFIIDYNKVQAKGFVCDDMTLEPLEDKLKAFNLDVHVVKNGHDVSEIIECMNTVLTSRRGKPAAIILNTIKGYPIEMCEYNPNWHTSAPRSVEQASLWLDELWEKAGKRLGVDKEVITTLAASINVAGPLHDNPDKIDDKQA